MGIDGKISDPDCRRDAAVALEQLCKLDDIKARLLSAPNGFEGVLRVSILQHQLFRREPSFALFAFSWLQ